MVSPHGQDILPMRLNYDILIAVMAFARRSDVGRVMSTCRTLYRAGVPHLLRGSIKIKSAAQLNLLCEYMRGDLPYRSRYLRGLDLSIYADSLTEDAAPPTPFVTLLSEYAQNLEALDITYTDTLASVLSSALSTSKSLRTLTISAYSWDLEHLLREIHAPIKALNITFEDEWHGDGVIDMDPAIICAPLKDYLEYLRVSDADFATSHIQYPRLKSLRVGGCKFAEIEHIFNSFPNLSNLDLRMHHGNDTLSALDIQEHRMLNIEAQQRGCWRSLRYLEADLLSLYMLGVQSTVDSLRLVFGLLNEARDGPRLRAVLSDTHPSNLELSLPMHGFDLSKLGDLLDPAKDRLTILLLTVEAHGHVDPSPALNAMFSTLSSFSIRLLYLRIRWIWTNPPSEGAHLSIRSRIARAPDAPAGQPPAPPPTSGTRVSTGPRPLNAMDKEAIALMAMHALPTVQYLYLLALNHTDIWEFQRRPRDGLGVRERSAVRLTKEEGRHILREHGLDATKVNR
ncbi:hypothetical protein PHLGIDRAFT_12084 [Phlebiopsis gigantea 11061_1 CR5-6]|uniref:F-box domain-containing protein n=1 Tax=Phlebiopsis gigantea (strain 11061_1 CR5-6) TaxID=745531 RepID=A0A0C3PQF1_PHLG1|nr:hypothetical protein PHLGIDRAFT_12084 [Phlebiopsis gigantea 11061_1 CR5-6]